MSGAHREDGDVARIGENPGCSDMSSNQRYDLRQGQFSGARLARGLPASGGREAKEAIYWGKWLHLRPDTVCGGGCLPR